MKELFAHIVQNLKQIFVTIFLEIKHLFIK